MDVGYGSAMVAPRVGEVVGIDVSEEAVAWARAKHQLDDLEFMTTPVTELSFPDCSFDAAYQNQVIEHIEDIELHLCEMVRVWLRYEGCLGIHKARRQQTFWGDPR